MQVTGWRTVEQAKIALQSRHCKLALDALLPVKCRPLSRLEFETCIEQFSSKAESTVARLLPSAGISAERIDTIFYRWVKGIPALRQRIAAQLPRHAPLRVTCLAVSAFGLAVDAARHFG